MIPPQLAKTLTGALSAALLALCCFTLAAQSQDEMIRSAINRLGLGQDVADRIMSQRRAASNVALLYANVGTNGAEINSVIDDKSFVGYSFSTRAFDPTPDNLERLGKELAWRQEDAWALYSNGQKVASGSKAPTIADLQEAFAGANIPNRVIALRKFLAANPASLSARTELMKELHNHAYQKTLAKLNIAPRDRDDSSAMRGSTLMPESQGELSEEDDLNLWGEIAGMMAALFAADEWLAALPDYFARSFPENMALHSPLMKDVYKKNLAKVEREIENRQTDFPLWKMWQPMAQATGRRILDFFPRFDDPPTGINGIFWPWPPGSVEEWMAEEAKLLNDWAKVVEFKWPGWGSTLTGLNNFAPAGRMPNANPDYLSRQRDSYWKDRILPLLEAALNAKDFGKANEIYFDISQRPVFEREAKTAVAMAKGHKHEFPQPPSGYKVGGAVPVSSFIGDPVAGNQTTVRIRLDSLKDLARFRLSLLVIDPKLVTGDSDEIRRQDPYNTRLRNYFNNVLSQGKLPEYYLQHRLMRPGEDLAVELADREGLARNAYVWGIFDDSGRFHRGGNSTPTADKIQELLDSMRARTCMDFFREFAKGRPDSITAKMLLLIELTRLGNIRSPNAKMDANGFLDETADYDIWGEYAAIANSVIPHLALHANEFNITRCFNLPFIKNSRQLQRLAIMNIETIENALRANPHSRELWRLWGIFGPHAPNRSLPELLPTLAPVPDLRGFPPVFLYPELIAKYKSLQAWGQIVNLLEPVWGPYQGMADAGEDIKHRLTKEVLTQYVDPLCEAYKKIGQDYKADKVRATWKKAGGAR